ncbi:hypothetical protein RQP46_004012 [Phenoliferia psychrophenolica]
MVPDEIISLILEALDDREYRVDEEERDEDKNGDAAPPPSGGVRQQTLARCCRVSRAFLPKYRQLLYHTIRYNIETDLSAERLRLLFCDDVPHLASLVRTFHATVAFSSDARHVYRCIETFTNLEVFRIRIEADNPGPILSTVTRLLLKKPASERPTGFKLDFTRGGGTGPGSENLRASLEALLDALPNLTHLSLTGELPRLIGPPPPFHLVHLSLTQSNFDLASLELLTKNSQSTLATLILANLGLYPPWETIAVATFHLTSQFPLETLEILNYSLPRDRLPLLLSLPATLQNLSIPETSSIVPFLGSEACPNLRTLQCWTGWQPSAAKKVLAEQAVLARGLFLVPGGGV